MKSKTVFITILVMFFVNCNSQNNRLVGTWQLIDIDQNENANALSNYFLNLYGYDTDDPNIKNTQNEIMVQMMALIKIFGLKISFIDGQIKSEIMGQRIVNSYRIKNNTIIVQQNGIETENDFSFNGERLIYAGFIWEKVSNP
ncbi:hypothetical protein PilKf_01288 [Pillotina sp. SPG140]